MSFISSLNASTLLAQASLNKGTERAAVSMERLSTGLAVANAKDDPSAHYAGSTLGGASDQKYLRHQFAAERHRWRY